MSFENGDGVAKKVSKYHLMAVVKSVALIKY